MRNIIFFRLMCVIWISYYHITIKTKLEGVKQMGVKYNEIIERMRWAGKLKNDSAVARSVGVTPQALSNYKKKGKMPTDLVLRFSNIFGLSLDWLISGDGEVYRPGARDDKTHPARLSAAEETLAYNRPPSISEMNPDEIIYVGKLLKIIREGNRTNVEAIKHTVDSFLHATELPTVAVAE